MLRNEHSQDDIMYITHITRSALNTLGVWPSLYRKKSIVERIRKFLIVTVSHLLLYFVLIPGAIYWMMEKNARIKVQALVLPLYGVLTVSKYGYLLNREEQIKICLKHIEEDWKNVTSTDVRDTMIQSARTGRRLVLLCAVFMYGSGLSFRAILPFTREKIVSAQNITIKPLPCPGYYFYLDIQSSPTYEVIFVTQVVSGLVTYAITTSVCGIAAVFVMHICGQLKILIDLMKDLVKEDWQKRQEVDRKLAKVVEHQIRIRRFLQVVEDTVRQICFLELTGCTIIICAGGYYLNREWQNHNILAMISYTISISSMMINMFVFCYIGEQLTSQAEKVAIVSCELEWFRLPDKTARGIILVMMISNLPTKVTAGKIIDLSLKTFGDVIKTAVAYCNIFRKVTD